MTIKGSDARTRSKEASLPLEDPRQQAEGLRAKEVARRHSLGCLDQHW